MSEAAPDNACSDGETSPTTEGQAQQATNETKDEKNITINTKDITSDVNLILKVPIPNSKLSVEQDPEQPPTRTSSETLLTRALQKPIDTSRLEEYGLGRGVNAADRNLWANKSSFQVCKVTPTNIFGTEEGGALQFYETEVTSKFNQQTSMKLSVSLPKSPPTSIGIDAEQSRSVTKTRKAVGLKVLNRTISFQEDFKDVGPYMPMPHKDTNEFEERLCKWLFCRIREEERVKKPKESVADFDNDEKLPSENMKAYLDTPTPEKKMILLKACQEFVDFFRITHYVSSIELGASVYEVYNEAEYYTKFKTGTDLSGIKGIAGVNLSAQASWNKYSKSKRAHKLGKITKDKKKGEIVMRDTLDEAVIGIKIEPITRLVKIRPLFLALSWAVVQYIDHKSEISRGPFKIVSSNDRWYWKVDKRNYALRAQASPSGASYFRIFPSGDDGNDHEFLIGYVESDQDDYETPASADWWGPKQSIVIPPRYLKADCDIAGNSSGPLSFHNSVYHRHSRMSLFSRIITFPKTRGETKDWYNGELLFLRCSRRRLRRDGYVMIHGDNGASGCAGSIRENDEYHKWMLFRLIAADEEKISSMKPHIEGVPDIPETLKNDFEEFFVTFASPEARVDTTEPRRLDVAANDNIDSGTAETEM